MGGSELKLHDYQRYCVDQILSKPKIALMLDMGLGKTAITLMALKEMKWYRWQIMRVLIIAPKKVAEATWQTEAGKWSNFNGLRVSTVLGTEKQRIEALNKDADIWIINRDNVAWLVEYFRNDWPFDCVVLDESSSFKNHRAIRFRALKAVLPKINRLIELTGTPAPHGLEDLWAQVYLLDKGARLGRTISCYRDMYFVPDKRNAAQIWSYKPREGAAEVIYDSVSDICISMKAKDYLSVPDSISEVIPVVLDKKAQAAYAQLECVALLAVAPDEVITAGSAAVLTGKLLQLCNGAVYDENGEWHEIHNCKIDAFIETVEQLNGQHTIVYYNFRHDLSRLKAALAKHFPKLTVKAYANADDEKAWNNGEIDVLLAHPASCGYGLNLQQGGHHIIWFGLTYALEQYQQANARLHRQGQTEPVIIHHLVVQGGMDEAVMSALQRKDDTQEFLLNALKVRIDSIRAGRDAV